MWTNPKPNYFVSGSDPDCAMIAVDPSGIDRLLGMDLLEV